MPKAHITVTGKTDALVGFINDHALHLSNYNFFSVVAPLPRKHWGVEAEAVEAWGCTHQPYVKVLSDKKPLENPKDFSLDEIVYEMTWALPVFPPNRWLEQASELYGLQMLLEFTDGERITILECNSKGEVVLDKELERSAAREFFDINRRLLGFEETYSGSSADRIKEDIEQFRSLTAGNSFRLADLLADLLTEEELSLTAHKYTLKKDAEKQAKWEETKKTDPYWVLRAKKDKSRATLDARLKEARDKGELQAAAGIAATHHDLMWESVVGDGAFGHFGGLTKDFKGLATDLYNIYPDLRPFFPNVMLLGHANREVEFRRAYKKVVKNAKDRERKAAKREATLKANEEALAKLNKPQYLQPVETQKINLFGHTDNGGSFNLSNLISAEAESLKGDK